MTSVLLIQLPVPQLTYGRCTGNVPLAGAYLQLAARNIPGVNVALMPESQVSYLGDAALLERICALAPDVVGFTVYMWNVTRTLYMIRSLKAAYGPRIVMGGPEVTPDNPLIQSAAVDFYVYGEGEAMFRRLLQDQETWQTGSGAMDATHIFKAGVAPYPANLLEHRIEDLMLLETQRGCPYRCGFCYYGKSRRHLTRVDDDHVLKNARWAMEGGVGELYLLDPALNTRPGLRSLLRKLADLRSTHAGYRRTALISEIRADAVDPELADRIRSAGFTWLEIGLQSTNPEALKHLRRLPDATAMLRGAERLQKREIQTSVDLIAGLPGDDWDGFRRSMDTVAAHGLQEDIQVFPLALLPGTQFRRQHRKLGLHFEPNPPYTVISTPHFTEETLIQVLPYAEEAFDTTFSPMPDVCICRPAGNTGDPHWGEQDLIVTVGEQPQVAAINLFKKRPRNHIRALASKLTHPYQLLVGRQAQDLSYLQWILETVTRVNPHTPLEVVLFTPDPLPAIRDLLTAVRLQRPHYLDGDLRYLHDQPGNRAVLFSLVSQETTDHSWGDMTRQIYWWKDPNLPDLMALDALAQLDGVLIDSQAPAATQLQWQIQMATAVEDLPLHVGFADSHLQWQWLARTSAEDYWLDGLPGKKETPVS